MVCLTEWPVCLPVASSCKGVFDFEYTYTWVVHILFLSIERKSGTFIHDRVGMVSLPEHLHPSSLEYRANQSIIQIWLNQVSIEIKSLLYCPFFARSRAPKPRAWGGWYWVFRRLYQYGQNWWKRFCKIECRGNGNLMKSLLDYHVCFCEDRFSSFRCS